MIDLYDSLWAPRLIVRETADIIKNTIDRKVHRKVHLPMLRHGESHLYPRPGLRRDSYISLNGEWDFCGSCPFYEDDADDFADTINVPFPVESALSGIDPAECGSEFAYRLDFKLVDEFKKDRIILHFGAIDQECRILLNGKFAGSHEGGYLPFEFDITDHIRFEEDNELIVKVRDTLDHRFPYGKQTLKPEGMWYTPVSGIWQTVWLESVPKEHIDRISCVYDPKEDLPVCIHIEGNSESYRLTVFGPTIDTSRYPEDEDAVFTKLAEDTVLKECIISNGDNPLDIDDIRLWSPEEPYLYRMRVCCGDDTVESYFTLRTVSVKTINGKERICLNDRPYFMHGVLDQGYFSDGLYTPVSDLYYEDDIRCMKELGFNVLRKHIKVEPERFYYECDRLGMIVFQDMVNNGEYSFIKHTVMPTFAGQWKDDRTFAVTDDIKDFFIKHSIDTVRYLKKFGCVLYYTVFNEGWGQFESGRITGLLKKEDPARLYDQASGWFKQVDDNESDVDSDHFYYHKIKPHNWHKPVIISECGGFTRHILSNSYCPDKIYGYGDCDSEASLTERIFKMYDDEVIPNMVNGICGCIYTQLSDVETESNGLYTYDREVCKVNKNKMKELALKLNKAYEYVTE